MIQERELRQIEFQRSALPDLQKEERGFRVNSMRSSFIYSVNLRLC